MNDGRKAEEGRVYTFVIGSAKHCVHEFRLGVNKTLNRIEAKQLEADMAVTQCPKEL